MQIVNSGERFAFARLNCEVAEGGFKPIAEISGIVKAVLQAVLDVPRLPESILKVKWRGERFVDTFLQSRLTFIRQLIFVDSMLNAVLE